MNHIKIVTFNTIEYSLNGVPLPYGVRPEDNRGVPGVIPPGGGSRKCSLNHLKTDATESNICCLNRNPSGVTVIYSCRTLLRGR